MSGSSPGKIAIGRSLRKKQADASVAGESMQAAIPDIALQNGRPATTEWF